eukprot:scaffold181254_cov40-Prasinocladus_malaysianus.AAC.1
MREGRFTIDPGAGVSHCHGDDLLSDVTNENPTGRPSRHQQRQQTLVRKSVEGFNATCRRCDTEQLTRRNTSVRSTDFLKR